MDTPPVYPKLNCYDNLFILYGINRLSNKQKGLLDDIGFNDFMLNRKAGYMSLGQRHRFGIVAALLCESDYMILDEPDLGLDPESTEIVITQLKKKKSDGCTILVTGQNFTLYEELADDIAVLHEGKCIYNGSCGLFMNEYTSDSSNLKNLKNAYMQITKGE